MKKQFTFAFFVSALEGAEALLAPFFFLVAEGTRKKKMKESGE